MFQNAVLERFEWSGEGNTSIKWEEWLEQVNNVFILVYRASVNRSE